MHSKGLLLPSHQSTYVQIAVAAHFSFVPACPTCKEAEEGPRVPYLCPPAYHLGPSVFLGFRSSRKRKVNEYACFNG